MTKNQLERANKMRNEICALSSLKKKIDNVGLDAFDDHIYDRILPSVTQIFVDALNGISSQLSERIEQLEEEFNRI